MKPAQQGNIRRSSGKSNVPAEKLALVHRGFAKLARANALHTLIRQRHLTLLCRGRVPTAETSLDPARMFMKSLTTGPELENRQGGGQSKLKSGAARFIRLHPQPASMRIYDRPADRQPHS